MFDCMTATERPVAFRYGRTSDQRAPACTWRMYGRALRERPPQESNELLLRRTGVGRNVPDFLHASLGQLGQGANTCTGVAP